MAKSNDYILLIPGAASSGDQISLRGLSPVFGPIDEGEYFKFLKRELSLLGYKVQVCPKNSDGDQRGVSTRAFDCKVFIYRFQRKNSGAKFHIIGHSMGGIVARKIIGSPTITKYIKSVTTISTPHKGSELASLAINNYDKSDYIGRFLRLIDFTPKSRKYLDDISLESNYIERLKNPKNIPIYSISNYKTNNYNIPFNISSKYISSLNDGVIETSSMKYGVDLGTIEADHFESACILYTQKSRGCKKAFKLIVDHLQQIY
jgi:triacylglycerol lipase